VERFIKKYQAKFLPIVFTAGSFGSMLGVGLPFVPPLPEAPWWVIALITLAVLSLLIAVVFQLKSGSNVHIYLAEDKKGIRNYMYKWLKNSGRCAIWTRDMSWGGDQEMVSLLKTKAKTGELIICLPQNVELTNSLQQIGAEIVAYGASEAPSTRFTIVEYERAGSRVAVAIRKGNWHVIEEFSAEDHTAFYMAQDLVRLVRSKEAAVLGD
jgi:hypothetical protein